MTKKTATPIPEEEIRAWNCPEIVDEIRAALPKKSTKYGKLLTRAADQIEALAAENHDLRNRLLMAKTSIGMMAAQSERRGLVIVSVARLVRKGALAPEGMRHAGKPPPNWIDITLRPLRALESVLAIADEIETLNAQDAEAEADEENAEG